MSTPIFVTRPSLPPLEELIPLLREIWDRRVLTNNGPFHQAFERAIADYLGVNHLSVAANGTLALSLAIDAAELEGEVITTPYSFVATAHASVIGQLEPVFVETVVELPQALLNVIRPGDVVLTMGAGSVGQVPSLLASTER